MPLCGSVRLSHSLLVCLLRLSCLSPCVLQYRPSPLGLQVWIEPEHDIDVLQRVLLLSLVPAGGPGGRGRGRRMKPTRTGGLHPLDKLSPLKTHVHTHTHTRAHTYSAENPSWYFLQYSDAHLVGRRTRWISSELMRRLKSVLIILG